MLKKRLISLLLAVSLILSAVLVLNSCNDNSDDENNNGNGETNNQTPEKVDYTITLKTPKDTPVSNVIVTLYKGTESLGMYPTNKDGAVKFNVLPGDYTFTLTATGDEQFDFDEADCVLNSETLNKTVVLTPKISETLELYNGSVAGIVSADTYRVEFTSDALTYFLFIPETTGRYKVSVSSDVKANVGYYGAPLIIHEIDISNESDREDGALYIDVRNYNIGNEQEGTSATQYLIGVKGEAAGEGFITVERVGSLEISPIEAPWQDYVQTNEIKPFTFAGGTLKDIDITDESVTVVLGADGYYHYGTAEGPIVYMRLSTDNKYTASIKKMCETQHFGRYYYDDNGKFLYKISYQKTLLDYVAAAEAGGSEGIYPLTSDLASVIKDIGEYLSWFAVPAPGELNIFLKISDITKNAWLFACCYVESAVE